MSWFSVQANDRGERTKSPNAESGCIVDTQQVAQEPGMVATTLGCRQESLTPGQVRELSDPEKQEQYRLAYRLQQARRLCPGCGEDAVIF